MTYHVSWNGRSDISDSSSSYDTTDDDLSNAVGTRLKKSTDANEQTAQEDGALSADLHSVETDAKRHDSGREIVDGGDDRNDLRRFSWAL